MLSPFLLFKGKQKTFLLAIFICFGFFVLFSILSFVRHSHYESYGFDLGINDQTVWRYSNFQLPLTTIAPFPEQTKLHSHVELIYAFIAPSYWIWSSRRMLLLLSALAAVAGGLAVYLLARARLKSELLSFSLMFSYLMFYGVQFAIWFDVHSTNFAAAFLMWFIYFVDQRKNKSAVILFILAATSKENISLYLFVICCVYLIRRRSKLILSFAVSSIVYLFFIYGIYFPYIVKVEYLYQNRAGFLSNINPWYLVNTSEKVSTIFYSFLSFGFLPLLNPLTIPIVFSHFATFFVVASDLPGAQGLFGHYRITLAPLLSWSTIIAIGTFKVLRNKYIALYLIFFALLTQYLLHLPLSYLTKSWFWTEPEAVSNINKLIDLKLPLNASVVSQNNITPHISHRDKIYTLYPESKEFRTNSPCAKLRCDWFRWYGEPEFLIVDTSTNWDARHFLSDRKVFLKGLENLEKAGVIKVEEKVGSATLYKVLKSPNSL